MIEAPFSPLPNGSEGEIPASQASLERGTMRAASLHKGKSSRGTKSYDIS